MGGRGEGEVVVDAGVAVWREAVRDALGSPSVRGVWTKDESPVEHHGARRSEGER